jgi:quinolinate synthase
MVAQARLLHPHALVLMHPEVPHESRLHADQILSTGGMCEFARKDWHEEFIIATETGILHTLKKQNPSKQFFSVAVNAVCPNMKKTSLDLVIQSLEGTAGLRVTVDPVIAEKASASLIKMLEMSK